MSPVTAALRPESRPVEPSPLGRLAVLPEDLIIKRILPDAVEKGFLPGFQYASMRTMSLSVVSALHIETQYRMATGPTGATSNERPHCPTAAQAYDFLRIVQEPEGRRAGLLIAVEQPKQARFWLTQAVMRQGAAPSLARSQALLTLGKFDSLHTGHEAAITAYDEALRAQSSPRRRIVNSITINIEISRAEALLALSVQPDQMAAEALRLRARARLGLFRASIDSKHTSVVAAFWLGESYRLDARVVQSKQQHHLAQSEQHFREVFKLSPQFELGRTRLSDVQHAHYLATHSVPSDGSQATAVGSLHDCRESLPNCLLCTSCRMGMADLFRQQHDTKQVYWQSLTAHLDAPAAAGPNAGLAEMLQIMPPVYQELQLHEQRARAALMADPGHVGAQTLLGMSLARRGQAQEARSYLQFAAAQSPYAQNIKEELAKVELHLGHWASAVSLYDSLLRAQPNSAAATLGLARAHRARGAHRHASALYYTAIGRHPGDDTVRYEAKTCLEFTVKKNPADLIISHRLAHLYLEDLQLDEAGATYNRIVHLSPADTEGLLGRARVSRCRHAWRDAHADYTAAIATAPKPDEVRLELVLMLLQMGELEEACHIATDIGQRKGITEDAVPQAEVKWLSDLGSVIAKHRHGDRVTGILRHAYVLYLGTHPGQPESSMQEPERVIAPMPQRPSAKAPATPPSREPQEWKATRAAPPPPRPKAASPTAEAQSPKGTQPPSERATRPTLSPLARHVMTIAHAPAQSSVP